MTKNTWAIILLSLIIQSSCQGMNEEQNAEYQKIRQMYGNYGQPGTVSFKDKLLTVKITRDSSNTETTEIFARLKTLKTTVKGQPLNESQQNFINQMQTMGIKTDQFIFGSTIVTQEPEEQLIQTIVKFADGNESITNHLENS